MGMKRGFTLIELLIVIGIIGFLAAAILVAVDPVKRIQDARNSKRWSEVNAILNAILTKQVDDRAIYDGETAVGNAPIITHDTYSQVIVRDDTGIVCNQIGNRPGCPQQLDISGANKNCVANIGTDGNGKLVPKYIAEIPTDPLGDGAVSPCDSGSGCLTDGNLALGATNTGYYIHRTNENRIEIGACYPDQGATIMVKR
jgi:prepilin-type N-terminal cleavage/methylation domain-containing protein